MRTNPTLAADAVAANGKGRYKSKLELAPPRTDRTSRSRMESKRIHEVVEEWAPRLLYLSELDAGSVVDGKWTRRQLLGHLIDSAINNYHRFVTLRASNLVGFPGYNQESWVAAGAYNASPLTNLVHLWVALNRQIAVLVDNAVSGAEYHVWVDRNLTFGFLLNEYVSHMLRHLPEIAYGHAVAPAAARPAA
ncbi:DinB family protein [Xanthomonas graminis]|nr:hypothetical protein [Xanthomonas translucens]